MTEIVTCCPRCGVRLVGTARITGATIVSEDAVVVSLSKPYIQHKCLRTAQDQLQNKIQDAS